MRPVERPDGAAELLRRAARRVRSEPDLRRSLAGWTAAGLVATVGGAAVVGALAGSHGLRGVGPSAVWAALGWWVVVSLVVAAGSALLMDPASGRRVSGVGLPNGLTALRAYLCAPVVLLALLPDRTLGRELFLAVAAPVAMLDAADGYLARRAGMETVLGRALDPIMDTLFFSLGAVACWVLGLVRPWFALLVLARYALPGLAVVAVYPRLRRRPPVVATPFGKASTLLISATLLASSLLVLAGGPAAALQVGAAVVIAAAALGHLVVLVRRTRLAAAGPRGAAPG